MAGVLEYDSRAVARVQSGFETPLTQYYRIRTTDGWLRAEPTFDVGVENETSLTYGVDGREVTERFRRPTTTAWRSNTSPTASHRGETPRLDRDEESVAHADTLAAIFESAESGERVTVGDE